MHEVKDPPAHRSSADPVPAVDLDRLHEMLGDDPQEVADILNVYLSEMTLSLRELATAIASDDLNAIELIAHNCAGVSANCGMSAVVEPLQELQKLNRVQFKSLYADVVDQFDQVKQYLLDHELFVPI